MDQKVLEYFVIVNQTGSLLPDPVSVISLYHRDFGAYAVLVAAHVIQDMAIATQQEALADAVKEAKWFCLYDEAYDDPIIATCENNGKMLATLVYYRQRSDGQTHKPYPLDQADIYLGTRLFKKQEQRCIPFTMGEHIAAFSNDHYASVNFAIDHSSADMTELRSCIQCMSEARTIARSLQFA